MRHLLLATAAVLVGVVPAATAPLVLSGRADVRGGYGSNPYLQLGGGGGQPVVGVNISPTISRETSTGTTSLIGNYSREQYFNGGGHPDTLELRLRQIEQFSPSLSMTAEGGYSTSTNALNNIINPDLTTIVGAPVQQTIVDPLTIGLRTSRYLGNVGFTWRPSDVDSVQLTGGFVHGLANGSTIGSYDFYNGGIGYTRSVSSRARIGGLMGYSRTSSRGAPTVTTYEPSVVLVYQFSEIWAFNGNVGASIRRVPSQNFSSTGLGFNLSFCGSYPVTSVCVSGARITSASGFGGARINTNLGVNITHQISAKDSASFGVSYVNSKAVGNTFNFGQQFTQVNGSLDHKLGPRWSVGIDGRFQSRSQDVVSEVHALNGTLHLSYLFGRVG